MFCISIVLGKGIFSALLAFAAPEVVTNLSDQPSTLVVSAEANHTFRFTLTDGLPEGSTMSLIFPSAFDTSTIIEDDVDISADGVDVATAVSCAGSEPISLAMFADVLTFAICAGDGGAMSAGTVVVMEVGTNASFSGTGSHKIVNPSTPGTYYVGFGGTSGTQGSIPIPIVSSDSSGVSGVVTSSTPPDDGGGGGGGDGPPPDEPPDDPEEPPEEPEDPPDEPEEPPEEPEEPPEVPPVTPPTNPPTTPTTPTTGGGVIKDIDVTVTVSAGNIPLSGNEGAFTVIPGTTPVVRVTVTNPSDVAAISIVIGEGTYILSQISPDTYQGLITAPSADGVLNVVVTRKSGGTKVQPAVLHVVPAGRTYEIIDGVERGIQNVIVTAYTNGGGRILWDASDFGEVNPQRTTLAGGFGWYAPNGSYVLIFEKEGYETATVPVSVSNHVLGTNVRMVKEQVIVEPEPEPEQPIEVPEQVEEVASAVENILNAPETRASAMVAIPVAAALVASSAVVLASTFNLLTYLQYLFTSPLLIFGRKKRKNYGIVYNAVTKAPIELAVIRLYRVSDNRLMRSAVTNSEGKYFLLAPAPGQYRLMVVKAGFVFPSAYINGATEDGKMLDIYTNQVLAVTEKDSSITPNIPLDPSDAPEFQGERRLKTKRFLRTLQRFAAPLGVILSLFVLITLPSVFAGVMFVAQLGLFALSLRLAAPKKPKGWGFVQDTRGRSPLGNVVVRLFEPRYNKLVESTLTDSRGRYSFLLGPNEYFVSFSKPGFTEKILRPIDYRGKSELAPLTERVTLDKV